MHDIGPLPTSPAPGTAVSPHSEISEAQSSPRPPPPPPSSPIPTPPPPPLSLLPPSPSPPGLRLPSRRQPDLGGAVAPGVSHLVRQDGPVRLGAEVDEEVGVKLQSASHRVDVESQHVAAAPVPRKEGPYSDGHRTPQSLAVHALRTRTHAHV